jgi:hypothetical protein
MTNVHRPIVGASVEPEHVAAAQSIVEGYLDHYYKNDFIILDSWLLRIDFSEEAGERLIMIEYSCYKLNERDILGHNFDAYYFDAWRVEIEESTLLSDKHGFSVYTTIDGEPFMSYESIATPDLEREFEAFVDKSDFERKAFEEITERNYFEERVFSFDDVSKADDIRDFRGAVSRTLEQFSNGTFDPASDNEWWSEYFDVSPRNMRMFRRFLEYRLNLDGE